MNQPAPTSAPTNAQEELNEVEAELNDLYRQVREKEKECEMLNRIVNPEDYSEEPK